MMPTRFGHHTNAFGFLRLCFATLVIVAHVPELRDGHRGRELLTQWFGTLSFGELAVDGFFLISGYLIVASYLNSRSVRSYLIKRVARIYPGFLVAALVCVAIVAPLGGASLAFSKGQVAALGLRTLLLASLDIGPVFSGTPYPSLDGAMWTIGYEFRCYLLVAALGVAGVLRWRGAVLAAAVALLLATIAFPETYHPAKVSGAPSLAPYLGHGADWSGVLFGDARPTLRLFGMFLTGSCFFLYRERIPFRLGMGLLATGLLLLGLTCPALATPAVAIFGGYAIFACAALGGGTALAAINNRNDVSFGVYLYAWPMTKLVFWTYPHANLLLAGILTFMLAVSLGWLSWLCVEQPVMAAVRGRHVAGLAQPST